MLPCMRACMRAQYVCGGRTSLEKQVRARARKHRTRRGLHNSNSGSDESRLSRNVFSMNNSGRVVYTSDDISSLHV